MKKQKCISKIATRLFAKKTNQSKVTEMPGPMIKDSLNFPTPKPLFKSTGNNEQQAVELSTLASSQLVGVSKSASFDREVGHVIFSDVDHLYGTGSVSATYNVTPLHVFKEEPGAGDYYVVEATYTIKNDNMYHAPHTNMHGGVHVRIGGFCLESVSIKSELKSKNRSDINKTIKFASSPKPETDNIEHTYSVIDGWSVGGGLTLGVQGGKNCYAQGSGIEGSANANINFNISHTKSDTYTMNDLNIHNQSDNSVVQFKLNNRNVTHFEWSQDNGLSDCADFAKSSLIFHAYWIWHVPDIEDADTDLGMQIETTITPNYRSCRFYSTKADYDEWNDSYTMTDTNSLKTPNRTKSSLVEILNDTDKPISNIHFNKLVEANELTQLVPDYSSQSTFATQQTGKFCLDEGKYKIHYIDGNGKEMEYTTNKTLDLSDGKIVRLVASFDFKPVFKE